MKKFESVKKFEFEQWDQGCVTVNRNHAELFRRNDLTTFESIMKIKTGQIVKRMRPNRVTQRFLLADEQGIETAFFIKQHFRPTFRDYWKPLMRLTWPILGAQNEWRAILRFHQAGLSTMIPVAFGKVGQESFLVTAEINGCQKLSDWQREIQQGRSVDVNEKRNIISMLAQTTRRMHAAGLHHQDYYLLHLLIPSEPHQQRELHLIDLGRAGGPKSLATRWIVKDLAQLDSSAVISSTTDRLRFMKEYLGRNMQPIDCRLVARIQRKSRWISRRMQRN